MHYNTNIKQVLHHPLSLHVFFTPNVPGPTFWALGSVAPSKALGGGTVGALVGLVPAVFTLGLSIPIGRWAVDGKKWG